MPEKETKKPDYSNSAENLVNPSQVKELLNKMHQEESIKDKLEAELKKHCASIVEGIAKSGMTIAEIQRQIKEAVINYGSYQDTATGEYAVRYRKQSKEYHPDKFSGPTYERYRTAVIIEAIDTKVLEALIKGGQLEQALLERDGVISIKTDFAFYIR